MNNRLEGNNISTEAAALQLVNQVKFSGLTPLGTSLWNKILQPLVLGPARQGALQKPVVVICECVCVCVCGGACLGTAPGCVWLPGLSRFGIRGLRLFRRVFQRRAKRNVGQRLTRPGITDGTPAGENKDEIFNVLIRTDQELKRTRYGPDAISYRESSPRSYRTRLGHSPHSHHSPHSPHSHHPEPVLTPSPPPQSSPKSAPTPRRPPFWASWTTTRSSAASWTARRTLSSSRTR